MPLRPAAATAGKGARKRLGIIGGQEIVQHRTLHACVRQKHGRGPARPVAVAGPASPLPFRGIQEECQGVGQQRPLGSLIDAVQLHVAADKLASVAGIREAIAPYIDIVQSKGFVRLHDYLDIFQEMRLHGFKGDTSTHRFQTDDAVHVVRFYRNPCCLIQEVVPDDVHRGRSFRLEAQAYHACLGRFQGKFQGIDSQSRGRSFSGPYFVPLCPCLVLVLAQGAGKSPVPVSGYGKRGAADSGTSAAGQVGIGLPPVPGFAVECDGFYLRYALQGQLPYPLCIRHGYAPLLDDAPAALFCGRTCFL